MKVHTTRLHIFFHIPGRYSDQLLFSVRIPEGDFAPNFKSKGSFERGMDLSIV